MEKKHKMYLKLNLMTIFFLAVSFISVTLAWFAYTGFASSKIDVDIKAWYIEFNGESKADNEIVIPLTNIYPGMDTVVESVNIKNKGDSDAKLSYEIESVRILDEELDTSQNQNVLRDILTNNYPFSIDISLSKEYVDAGGGEASIDLSVSWPLDSDTDEDDSSWGSKTYSFQDEEAKKDAADPNYNARSSIKVVINLIAEQNIDKFTYNTGNMILFDPTLDSKCDTIGGSCYITNMITPSYDDNENVLLLPNILNDYGYGKFDQFENKMIDITSSWLTQTYRLELKDLINLVSNDVHNTLLIREGLSDSILGYIGEESRFDTFIKDKVINEKYNGYITFDSNLYDYLDTNKCYWINYEYGVDTAFAFTKLEEGKMKIYPENKESECYFVPVISVPRNKLYN